MNVRKLAATFMAAVCATALLLSWATAQPPAGRPADDAPKDKAKDYSNAPLVVRMMAFDKKKDGKLTRDEVTDERLQRLFDQADANKDGVVTKEELMALAAKLDAEVGPRGRGFGERGPGERPGEGPETAAPMIAALTTAAPVTAAPADLGRRPGPARLCPRSSRTR